MHGMLNFYENGPVIIINHEVIDRVGKKNFLDLA